MSAQMIRVISSPSISTTGVATLIFAISVAVLRFGNSRGGEQTGPGSESRGAADANGRPRHRAGPPPDGGKYRRGGARHGQFRPFRPAHRRPARRLAERTGG